MLRLVNWIVYVGLVFVTGAVIWQNRVLRHDLELLLGSHRPATAPALSSPRIVPGDQISSLVEGKTGRRQPFREVASGRGSYWWLFDPSCSACLRSAMEIAGQASEQIAALTSADRASATAFLKQYDVQSDVFVIVEKTPAALHVTPQFFRVDGCGTVTQTFSTERDFIDAASSEAPIHAAAR